MSTGTDTTAYKVYIVYDILCGTASVINLVMISLERCISVTQPAIHRNLSRTTIVITIVGAWIYALVVACVSQVNGSYLKWYPPFVSTASFFFPLFIILIAYSLIYKVAQTRERARRSRSLAREIRIIKFIKKFMERFLENAKFLGMDQITSKNCIKSNWMQVNKILLTRDRPEHIPLLFCMQFSMESNHYEMKPRSQSLSFS